MAEVYQRFDLFKKLELLNSNFDAEATIRLGFNHFGIKDKSGAYTNCGGFGAFCRTWCSKYGEYIDYTTKGSFQSGKLFYMTWKNLDKVENEKEVKPDAQEQKEIKETTLPKEEELILEQEGASTEVADVGSLPEIDWEWVDSLSNNKYGKKDLEDYAKPYKIDLKKNMSIDNMRKAFREHMGV